MLLKLKKIFLLFVLVFLLISSFANFVLAQETNTEIPLETEYPQFGNWKPTFIKEEKVLPKYIKYIFEAAVAISGIIIFGVIVAGGMRYLTSVGSPGAMKDAQSQIFSGFFGLVVLFASYMLLNTINPQLLVLEIEENPQFGEIEFKRPGVYLYANGIWRFASGSMPELVDFNDKVEKIKIVNPTVWDPVTEQLKPGDYTVGAILHEEANYKGQCKIFLGDTGGQEIDVKGKTEMGNIDGASSITIFNETAVGSFGEVKFCTSPDLENCELPNPSLPQVPTALPDTLKNKIQSIGINGSYLIVLFKNTPSGGGFDPGMCAVFDSSIPDMKNEPINKCDVVWLSHFFGVYKPCATAYSIYQIQPLEGWSGGGEEGGGGGGGGGGGAG